MNRALTQQLVLALTPTLRQRGFARRALHFQRSLDEEVCHLIQLQKSQLSSAQLVRATVNLAVWLPRLEPDRTATEAGSPVRARLGALMPERQDRWWECHDAATATTAAEEMLHALLAYGLPWLDALPSAAAVAAMWRSGVSPGLTELQRQRYLAALDEEPQPTSITA